MVMLLSCALAPTADHPALSSPVPMPVAPAAGSSRPSWKNLETTIEVALLQIRKKLPWRKRPTCPWEYRRLAPRHHEKLMKISATCTSLGRCRAYCLACTEHGERSYEWRISSGPMMRRKSYCRSSATLSSNVRFQSVANVLFARRGTRTLVNCVAGDTK